MITSSMIVFFDLIIDAGDEQVSISRLKKKKYRYIRLAFILF